MVRSSPSEPAEGTSASRPLRRRDRHRRRHGANAAEGRPAATSVALLGTPRTRGSRSAAASENASSPAAQDDAASSRAPRAGRSDEAPARAGREPGLHARGPRVEPQHHVAVLDPPRRPAAIGPRRTGSRPSCRKTGCSRRRPDRTSEVAPRSSGPDRRGRAATELGPRIPRAAGARVHRVDECRHAAADCFDRERLGRVVRGPEQEAGEQSSDRDALPRPQAERGPHPVVALVEDRLRIDPDDVVETSALVLQDEERGHHLRQAGDRPRLSGASRNRTCPEPRSTRMRRGGVHARRGIGSRRCREAGHEWRRRAVRAGPGVGGGATGEPRAQPRCRAWTADQEEERTGAAAAATATRRVTRSEVVAQVRAEQGLLELARRGRRFGEGLGRGAARVRVLLSQRRRDDRLEERRTRDRRSACTS